MMTVNEVSKRTGVSVRSLHHYDAIGLLKPAKVTAAGYRLYGDEELARLQNIMLFRELQFPLKQIKEILDSPGFDQKAADSTARASTQTYAGAYFICAQHSGKGSGINERNRF